MEKNFELLNQNNHMNTKLLSGWMQTIQNKIQGHFKDFEKKIKDMKKLFIHT